ncbi:hypothetical protein LWI28_016011 [Acer negundo]|uniref:MULE transposase domain-containing protein n=1 Tax=Acer negundo TaxID=4023 RepID=A0AAD5JT47_ACENE|nr:hypothetical protein LWI28_016011 [Acer negundo]
MFVATAQDRNEQVYPIVFGYGDSKNNLSWEWFLECLRGALGYIDDLIFISDRHAIIKAEIFKVFIYATRTICCWYFYENMKKRFHIKDIADIMDKVARTYREFDYNRDIEELRKLHKAAFDYVIVVGPHKWSRVHCLQKRYMVMTTNVVECINACLKFAQQLPMMTLVEFIRNILQKRERNLDFTSLCVDYYKRKTFIDAYSVPIMHVGHPSSWVVPSDIAAWVVLNPKLKRQSGHPMEGQHASSSSESTTT